MTQNDGVDAEGLVGSRLKDFTFIDCIGVGSFSVVFVVRCEVPRLRGRAYALKCLIHLNDNPKNDRETEVRNRFSTEIEILAQRLPKHRGLIPLLGQFVDRLTPPFLEGLRKHDVYQEYGSHNKSMFLIFPFYEHTLGQHVEMLKLNGQLLPVLVLSMLRDLLSAVEHLHKYLYCHRDLKEDNIMVDNEGRLVIVDFGLATQCPSNWKLILPTGSQKWGNSQFTPPEVDQAEQDVNYEKADLWAVGAIIYNILSPFKNADPKSFKLSALPLLPSNLPHDLGEFLMNLMQPSVRERFLPSEALQKLDRVMADTVKSTIAIPETPSSTTASTTADSNLRQRNLSTPHITPTPIQSDANPVQGTKRHFCSVVVVFLIVGLFLITAGVFLIPSVPPTNPAKTPSQGTNTIVIREVQKFGKSGADPGQFSGCGGVVVSREGRFIVCDRNNHRVQVFKSDGSFSHSFGEEGDGAGQFNQPYHVTLNSKGHLIVTDYSNHRIQVFQQDGTFLRMFGEKGKREGQLKWPTAVAVDKQDNVFVCDYFNDRICVFNSEGKFVKEFGVNGRGGGQLNSPKSIAIDSQERVIVAEEWSQQVSVFSKDGKFLYVLSPNKGVHGGGQFNPISITLSKGDHIIVGEGEPNNCLQAFSKDGQFLWEFTPPTNTGEESFYPAALTFTPSKQLAVADASNNCVRVFDLLG